LYRVSLTLERWDFIWQNKKCSKKPFAFAWKDDKRYAFRI